MKKQKEYIGGFVATNTGNIENSYSIMQVTNKEFIAGGFAGKNAGTIDYSFCDSSIKSLNGGFSGEGATSGNCYFFHNEDYTSKRYSKLSDQARGKNRDEVNDKKQAEKLRYDCEEIWEYAGKQPVLQFQSNKWLYDTQELFNQTDEDEILEIGSAEELFDFARRVNSGSLIHREGSIRITQNIDLGGREWIPIGESVRRSFQGVFDGCGHKIYNFVITNEEVENKGFFGFSTGSIYNLTVDCIIRGNGCIGGLLAQNVSGTIGCCAAIVTIEQKKSKKEQKDVVLGIGGLVGINTGEIFESYSAGHITCSAIIVFWPFIGIGAGIAALVAALIIVMNLPGVAPGSDTAPIFNKIPEEMKQTPIEDDEKTPRTDSNFVSFQFNKEIIINLDAGTCTLDYKNPGDSNHNTVVELQLTDTVAKASMGGTGRDAVEQSEYEAREDYDPEAYRVTIAASESVSPGFQVQALSLSDYAKQNMALGTYDAVIMIYPYDMNTNNKAMLESQLPVTIVVQ